MKNFGILLAITGIFSIVNYFTDKSEELNFKAPMIMSEHIIEREEYRDSIVESVINRTKKNSIDLEIIELKIQKEKNNK